ncbi:hypothetical protein PILCRDRAFT_86663 [Piloderma croceum F 1598]|uniref:Uncharacterized protein n=1 Tax=Piloderma croceum (strain F 1598) TaxID=765440 RepID=A0A0C3G234_PILCF|nr:hypothetical protein PILCRDRAFT_86663 [Piloderma croceum F 1598]
MNIHWNGSRLFNYYLSSFPSYLMANVKEQIPNTETEQSTEDVPQSEVAKKCLDFVKVYWRGEQNTSSKAGSTQEIITALTAAMPELSRTKFNDSLGAYLNMLDQHNQSIAGLQESEREQEPETEEDITPGSK